MLYIGGRRGEGQKGHRGEYITQDTGYVSFDGNTTLSF